MSTIILEKVEIKGADFHLFEELFKKEIKILTAFGHYDDK